MITILFAALLVVSSFGSVAGMSVPLCVDDPANMPESWQPPAELKDRLDPAPWSEGEAEDAAHAKRQGVEEMIAFFKRKPTSVEDLWGDSIEALIQVTYASANEAEFDAKVREAARDNLSMLTKLYFERNPDPDKVACGDFRQLLPLAIFAHRLYPPDDARTVRLTKRTNAAYRACGSLEVATELDFQKILANKQASVEDLFQVYIWTLWFMEAELFPAIDLPAEARQYGPTLWKYFKTYPLTGADTFEEGSRDEGFIAMADLAPHIAHLATGTNRYPLYVADHPDLYRFHRENFYDVLQVGELDLVASVVDTLRQYGCTPENDAQVRDGLRYLLDIFYEGGHSWMDYRQDGETDENIDDYGLIHYPWTSVLAVRERSPEESKPGTYGGLIRGWLPQGK